MKDLKHFLEEANIFSVQSLGNIKKRPDILEHIRFDVTPRMIMEPHVGREGKEPRNLMGYMFYIEALDGPPVLMLMKIGGSGIMSTAGKIDEIPEELIRRAVESPVEPQVNQMYTITEEIRDWLTGELGL